MSSSDSSDSSFFSSFFSSSLAVEGKQDVVKSKMTTQTKFRRKEKNQFDFWGTWNLNLKEKLKSGTSPRMHSHYCYVTANVALGNALFVPGASPVAAVPPAAAATPAGAPPPAPTLQIRLPMSMLDRAYQRKFTGYVTLFTCPALVIEISVFKRQGIKHNCYLPCLKTLYSKCSMFSFFFFFFFKF